MNRRRASSIVVGLIVSTTLLLAACGPAEPDLARDPHPVGSQLPEVDTTGMWLSTPYTDLRIVDPGWETTVRYADGVYLSAGERDGALEFTALDIHGDVLWAAQRPISCTGFTLSTDSTGRTLAVLTDTRTTDDALAGTTATAYDLTTGDHVWGPVQVPGVYQGPGLVYAAPPEGPMGDTGPRTALDPSTGHVAAEESDRADERIIGEYDGTLLLADGHALIGRDAAVDQDLWRIPLAEHGWTTAGLGPSLEASPGSGLALIETSGSAGALIDLSRGTVIDDDALDAAVDPTSGTRVVLDGDGLHASDAGGKSLWSTAVTPGTSIAALGGVMLYLREEDKGAVRVHNAITGDVAQAYAPDGHGTIVVPEHITGQGAALLLDGQRRLLATVTHKALKDGRSL